MDVSIVVPVFNERDSLIELTSWISRVCAVHKLEFEMILVDDGSNDGSWDMIESLAEKMPEIKGLKFRRNYGKSAALNEGFGLCNGKVVITMDADLQDSPDEIPELYKMIAEDGFDMVSGWKKRRKDPLSKRLPSKFFNMTTRKLSGIKLHDFNCGLKAYRNDLVKSIEVYGEMHRYIPVIAKWAGFKKIGEKVVEHYPRKFGSSKYGLERIFKGYLDMITITFTSRFGQRPMHFFGLLGSLLFFAGFCIAAYLAYAKIFMMEYKMTDRPLFYYGLLTMIMGTQLFVAGFLGELISRNSNNSNSYLVEKSIGISKSENG